MALTYIGITLQDTLILPVGSKRNSLPFGFKILPTSSKRSRPWMRAEGQTVPDKTVSKDAWGWDADWKNKEERN